MGKSDYLISARVAIADILDIDPNEVVMEDVESAADKIAEALGCTCPWIGSAPCPVHDDAVVEDAGWKPMTDTPPDIPTAWKMVNDVATPAVHAWADDRGLVPGLMVTDWVFLAAARGFEGDREVVQDVILRSGNPNAIMGMLTTAKAAQTRTMLRVVELD